MPDLKSQALVSRPMPYRKNSRSKKSYRKKPVYRKTSMRTAPRQEVKRNMRGINNLLTSTPYTSSTSQPFINISTGSSADKRIGNGIQAKGHLLSGVMRNESSKTMIVRLIYAYNRRVNNAAISTSSLLFLELGAPVHANSLGFKSMYAPLNREHYKIVSDQRFKLGESNVNASNVRILKKYTKLNHGVKYDDTVGANINYGNLQLFWIAYPADGVPVGSDNVAIDFESTCYFTE